MTTYKVSVGFDVASEDLVVINPQCTSQGVKYVRRALSASGVVLDQNLYVELEWAVLHDVTEYVALLTQFGLDEATTSPVTVLVRDEFYTFNRYNGLAVRPQPGQDRNWAYFVKDVVIVIKNLELLVEA